MAVETGKKKKKKIIVWIVVFVSCKLNFVSFKLDTLEGGRMGLSDKVSLWCVALLINTRFRFFILE